MALDSLRATYFKLEDKWYAALDRINSRVPVMGAVDRIDKVVPSFALFAFIVIVLLLFLAFSLPGMIAPAAAFSFRVVDTSGITVEGADVQVLLDSAEVFSQQTNEFGETTQVILPLNAEVEIKVSKSGFQSYSETLTVSRSALPYEIALPAIEEKTYTVYLKDGLGQPVREEITLSFQCRNSSVQAPQDMSLYSGVATVTEPENCNGLIASVQSSGFEDVDSVELTQSQQTIYLQAMAADSATITVELFFNGLPVSEEVTVYLYQDNGTDGGIGPIESAASENGRATFVRQPGSYFVKSSGSGSYTAVESAVFSVASLEQKTVQLHLERNVVGYIRLKVLDEETGEAVDGAAVLLRLGTQEIDSKETSAEGDAYVEFGVAQDTAYTVVVDHEAYCLKVVHDATIGAATREIELKPFSDDCGGELKVKVLDQDGRLVRGATVGLYTEAGFSTGFRTEVSDINGIALFSRVASGDYRAFAFKGASSGWSDVEHFVQRAAEKTILTVVLNVADGTVRVKVVDTEGEPLQFAQVAFIDTMTDEAVGKGAKPVEDINGIVELVTRADKKVYIVASKEGYATFTSVVKPVLPNSTQLFTAVLEKEIIQGEIKIEFKGVGKNGKNVSVLAPGEKYDALFHLKIPANKNYSRIGVHVRTGSNSTLELDKIVLKEINAPGRAAVLKATSYNPDNGYDIDSEHPSSDEAKWANVEWRLFNSGVIAVQATVRIKETATVTDELPLFYRAWGVEDGLYKRDPLDTELGEAEAVAGKEALYANAKREIFQVGTETQCDEQFCFSASVLDIAEGIAQSASDSYSGKIFKAYKLNFTILNNSEYETDSYIDADLRIANEDEMLLLQEYKVYGAQNQLTEGTATGNETGWVSVGNVLPNNTVSGSLGFTPQRTGSALLKIQLRSAQRIHFDKTISVNIGAENQLSVVIAPELLPSGVENEITVTARNKRTNLEIADALVKVKDRFGAVIAEKRTSALGVAVLTLPALQPAEQLLLIVGKPGYEAFEKEIKADEGVIEVKPATIGVSLNAKTAFDAEKGFSIENKTAFELTVKGMALNGRLYGLVDEEKVNNWLYNYIGETAKPLELKEMTLKVFLSEKGKRLEQSRQLDAQLDITVGAYGSEWTQSVPVKISIGLGGEVDDPTCFAITRKEWKGSTEGQPIEIEFEVQNNCSIGGAPISVLNIAAQAKWQTNHIGRFGLRTESSAIELASGYAKKFLGTLEPEQSVSVVLEFSPNAGVNGKGVAELIFQAENPTDTATQVLTDSLSSELVVVNLADCIAFSKDVLVIKPENSDSFEVQTIDCGYRNEIRIESDLTVSTGSFVLSEKDSREVEVLAEKNLPGQYSINVYAKGSDELQFKLIKTIRTRILSEGCLQLSRYEFDVFDNPLNPYDGYDTAELYNNCYDQPLTITVEWDEHDWGDAMKTGALVGLATGALGLVAKLSEGGTLGTAMFGGLAAGKESKEESYFTMPDKQTLRYDAKKGGYVNKDGAFYHDQPAAKAAHERILGQTAGQMQTGEKPKAETPAAEKAGEAPKTTTGGTEGGAPKVYKTMPIPPTIETPSSTPTGYQLLGGGGMGLGLMGIVFGMGKTIFGEPSFLSWGLMGFIGGTLWAYSEMEDGTLSFSTIGRDLQVKGINLLLPGATLEDNALVETPSKDIVVKDLGETSTRPREDNPRLSMETIKLGFLNTAGVVQPDPATPLFRILRVAGERIVWETAYEMDEEERPEKLQQKERKEHKERFRLQFNSFEPLAIEPEAKPIPNCKLGNVVGTTGPSAVPRVSFKWDWLAIAENACDEGNEGYIYCDATQFSIAVLKKLYKLQQFIETYKPFDCPSAATAVAVKNQPLLGTAPDVAITKIQANKSATSDANVLITVESNNAKAMDIELRVDLRNAATGVLENSCSRELSLLSKSVAECEFQELGEAVYDIEALITPTLCPGCENSDADNDSIEVQLYVGAVGIAECEPFNTARLPLFIEATEAAGNAAWSAQEREEILKTIKFNAYLVKDAYTNDFRQDFDLFCKTKSFFDCPSYYIGEEGLQRFFADSERFKFDYSMAPHAPAEAGKYAVTINVEFGNQNWDFFSLGEADATIAIEMVELSAPEPDSPFYYLPFDGLVGVDSANGRQGYGVNFRQTTEKTIKVNNSQEQVVIGSDIANSTPIFNGWIDAGFNDEFRRLNQDKRGILLDVQAGSEATNIVLSPSYATPVIMQVDYEKGEHAYSFYAIEIDQSPQTAFTKMIPWSGIGVTCRDFLDNPVTEAWQDTWDSHGGITGSLRCAIGTEITDYGIEWCNPLRQGTVYLESVVFTPQNSSSLIAKTAYSDEMTLIGVDNRGSQIALNGVPGMEYNSYGTSSIDSLEDILDLVRESKVCVIGQGSRISSQFFWNPKAILQELAQQRAEAKENCIRAS